MFGNKDLNAIRQDVHRLILCWGHLEACVLVRKHYIRSSKKFVKSEQLLQKSRIHVYVQDIQVACIHC